MRTFEAACPYCGQIQNIAAETQEEADRLVIERCSCEEGVFARRAINLRNSINSIAGSQAEILGFRPVSETALSELQALGQIVLQNEMQSVSVNIDETRISFSRSTKGAVRVRRQQVKQFTSES